MNHQAPLLKVDHLFFSYESTPILKDVCFSIRPGDFVGVFGPNGGGKTTLIQLILGFLKPDRGSIDLCLKPREIGYVPQIARFDKQFPITVSEVVEMGLLSKLSFWGSLSHEKKQQALNALDLVGMLPFKDQAFGKLSGGQAQRVLIARALASQPKFLILDEPTASVDPEAEAEILAILNKLKGDVTLLMVTHDLQTILEHVGLLLCVHGKVHVLSPSEVCEHFGLGLYHSPMIRSSPLTP